MMVGEKNDRHICFLACLKKGGVLLSIWRYYFKKDIKTVSSIRRPMSWVKKKVYTVTLGAEPGTVILIGLTMKKGGAIDAPPLLTRCDHWQGGVSYISGTLSGVAGTISDLNDL